MFDEIRNIAWIIRMFWIQSLDVMNKSLNDKSVSKLPSICVFQII